MKLQNVTHLFLLKMTPEVRQKLRFGADRGVPNARAQPTPVVGNPQKVHQVRLADFLHFWGSYKKSKASARKVLSSFFLREIE